MLWGEEGGMTPYNNKTPTTVQHRAKHQTETAFYQSRTQKAWDDRSPSYRYCRYGHIPWNKVCVLTTLVTEWV